jgi:succinylglutamate desuccinylase
MAAHHLKASTTALHHPCSTNSNLLPSALLEVVTDASRLVLLHCAAASSAKRVASAVPNAANAASKRLTEYFTASELPVVAMATSSNAKSSSNLRKAESTFERDKARHRDSQGP